MELSPLDRPIPFTFFTSYAASEKREEVYSLRAIAPRIKTITKSTKADLPWLKMAQFGDLRTDKNSLRHDSNVLAISGIEADYDAGLITVDEAVETLTKAGIACMVYTSPSHTEDIQKWRVLCPTSETMDPARRAHLVGRLNGLFRGAFAGESFTLSQSYYYGSVKRSPSHRVELIEGDYIDQLDELDEIWTGRTNTGPAKANGKHHLTAGPVDASALLCEIMDGSSYHVSMVRLAGKLARDSIPYLEARGMLIGAMETIPETERDARWRMRFADIDRTLEDIYGKEAKRRERLPPPEEPPPWVTEDIPASVPHDWAEAIGVDHGLGIARGIEQMPTERDQLLPYFTFLEASARIDVEDFVEGVLTSRSMAVIYGESGSGKTFFATDMGLHVAAGQTWRDREVEAGAVIYMALEGSLGIRNRITAWKEERGLGSYDLPFAVIPVGVNLLDPNADAPAVIATVTAIATKFNVPTRLIVIDTLSRAMAGGNENAPEDMTALIGTGDIIRQQTGACVLWIHHSGKDTAKGARGHSSLRAATDTEIEVTAEAGSHLARVTKQRDLEGGGEFGFQLKVVELGVNRRGKPVTSCVVTVGEGQAPGGASARLHRLSGHTKRAFEVLLDLVGQTGQTGHLPPEIDVPSVPSAWWRERFYEKAMPGAEQDTKKRTFRRSADALVDMKMVGIMRDRVWIVAYGTEAGQQFQ